MEVIHSKLSSYRKIEKFIKNNLKKSILSNNKFLKYNFINKRNLNIFFFLKKKEIISINFYIPNYCLYKKKKIKFTWSSALYSTPQGEKVGAAFQLMAKLHSTFPLVGSLCPNQHTLTYNNYFGKQFKRIALNRYLFINNKSSVNLIIKNKINKNFIFKKNKNIHKVKSRWCRKIPKDYPSLWNHFSKKFDLIILKNTKYLNKRYVFQKFINYRFVEIRKINNHFLLGFAIVRVQKIKKKNYVRIVDLITYPGEEILILNSLILILKELSPGFIDFFAVGDYFKESFKKNNFFVYAMKKNKINFPNLLSPLSQRQWTDYFHLGGKLKENLKNLDPKKVFFSKGDSDRDWPTLLDL